METTERFTGLAEDYSRFRPSYPTDAIDLIVERAALDNRSLVVDIGCGTGISTRLLAERNLRVAGVEPNQDMLAKATALEGARLLTPEAASQDTVTASTSATTIDTITAGSPVYIRGTAEHTGLPTGLAACVVCAQAFHWFDPEKALSEFHRLLKEGGKVALMWNERDEDDTFTRAYGDLLRRAPETQSVEMKRGTAGDALFESELFDGGSLTYFANSQPLDREGLLGRLFSTSYAPRKPEAREAMKERMLDLFDRFGQDEKVTMQYKTSVYLAGRRGRAR